MANKLACGKLPTEIIFSYADSLQDIGGVITPINPLGTMFTPITITPSPIPAIITASNFDVYTSYTVAGTLTQGSFTGSCTVTIEGSSQICFSKNKPLIQLYDKKETGVITLTDPSSGSTTTVNGIIYISQIPQQLVTIN